MTALAQPYFLFLLPLAALAAWRLYRRRLRSGLPLSTTTRIGHAAPTWRMRCAALLPALYVAALVCSIVALARPRSLLARHRRRADAIALAMVVDVSGSMEALDLSDRTPTGIRYRTRLDAVKETFADFVRRRPDDLIALVTFGGYASTRVPLTTDHEALLHTLQGVDIPRQVFADGRVMNQEELLTAIGDALATACARLKDAEPTSRVIVLLSDGESNTGAVMPEEAARLAASLGVRIYTIGIGTTAGRAPFRARDMFGNETIRYAAVSLDEPLLRELAERTRGRYFNVRDPRGLEQAMDDINRLETTRIDRHEYNRYREWFPWFLIPALLLATLATAGSMLTVRRVI